MEDRQRLHPAVETYLRQFQQCRRNYLFESESLTTFLSLFLDKVLQMEVYLAKNGWQVLLLYDFDERAAKLDLRLELYKFGIRWVFRKCLDRRQDVRHLWKKLQDLPLDLSCEFFLDAH